MAKVEWDYTRLADAYVHRPDYAPAALTGMFEVTGATSGMRACDIGAGVGHLTLPLLNHGLLVDAVEPNDRMRTLGVERTKAVGSVRWHDGTGERTGLPSAAYRLVTFGSSFNVCHPGQALAEASRLLTPGGWFVCLWNHRDLQSPLQQAVEGVIRRRVPDYDYGARRQDQRETIRASGLFGPVTIVSGRIEHVVDSAVWVEAWRSHATLARQAGEAFEEVVEEISGLVAGQERLSVPYETNIWLAQTRSRATL